jgi:hypothetical protein
MVVQEGLFMRAVWKVTPDELLRKQAMRRKFYYMQIGHTLLPIPKQFWHKCRVDQ